MVAQHRPAYRVRRLRVPRVGTSRHLALQTHVRDGLWVYGHHLDHLVVLEVAALGSSREDARVVVPCDVLVAIDIADVVDLGVGGRA